MNEIASDSTQIPKLEQEALPPAVAKLLTGPTAARLMITKGIAALRPAELVLAIYQLSFDKEVEVRVAAEAATAALPDKILAPTLAEALPAMVLHFYAE